MPSQQIAAVPAAPFPAPRDPSVFARTPATLVRWGWRARFHTAPIWLGGIVFVAGTVSPAVTGAVLVVVSGVALWASRRPRRKGRMWLSARERRVAAIWAAAGALWAASAWVPPLPPRLSLAVLAGLTSWPGLQWATSRRLRSTRLDRDARALVARWEPVVGAWGHERHRGSHLIPGSAKAIADGAVGFGVKLRGGVHSADAVTDDCRRAAEAAFGLPIGTLALTTVRDDSTVLHVTISTSRHMEGEKGLPYGGPVIEQTGRMPIALTQSGAKVGPRSRDKDGVKHMWINGATGGGKSTTTAVTLLPPVLAREEILFYLDGGRGTSLEPELAPVMTVTAFDERAWRLVIRMWHALMVDRQANRAGVTRWRNTDEPYPAIRLVIDEASEVARCVGQSEHDMVAKGGEVGRKVGTPTTQISQGTNADLLVGGTGWRSNASQILAHRPGSSLNANKALDSVPAAAGVDLMRLPAEPGWIALVDHGQVHFPVRVTYASPERLGALTAGFEPSQLIGRDLEVAAPFLAELRGAITPEPDPETPEPATSRDRLHHVMAAHGPIALGYLAPEDGSHPHETCNTPGCPGWSYSRKHTNNLFVALGRERRATKEGRTWRAV